MKKVRSSEGRKKSEQENMRKLKTVEQILKGKTWKLLYTKICNYLTAGIEGSLTRIEDCLTWRRCHL